jgi:simple sugar transport system permease protein
VPKQLTEFVSTLGPARLTIVAFLIVLFIVAQVNGLPMGTLISNSLVRIGVNGLLVLSMVPSIQSGAGLNFGLPIGVIAGLLGLLVVMEHKIGGLVGIAVAMTIAATIATIVGILYGLVLNKVKGQEMMIGTYIGFSIVSGMCIFWLLAPFKNPEMILVMAGKGLRTTLPLQNGLGLAIDNLGVFNIFGVTVSIGLLGSFAIACILLTLFFKTKLGISLNAAGANPAFAASCGIDVDRMRILGTTISTVLAAVGMVIYTQSIGYAQLYTAPLNMAFSAVAAILIGGATARRASVLNAVVGTTLFQTLLTIALPATRTVIEGDISEEARLIISSAMILYALTRKEGERR